MDWSIVRQHADYLDDLLCIYADAIAHMTRINRPVSTTLCVTGDTSIERL